MCAIIDIRIKKIFTEIVCYNWSEWEYFYSKCLPEAYYEKKIVLDICYKSTKLSSQLYTNIQLAGRSILLVDWFRKLYYWKQSK